MDWRVQCPRDTVAAAGTRTAPRLGGPHVRSCSRAQHSSCSGASSSVLRPWACAARTRAAVAWSKASWRRRRWPREQAASRHALGIGCWWWRQLGRPPARRRRQRVSPGGRWARTQTTKQANPPAPTAAAPQQRLAAALLTRVVGPLTTLCGWAARPAPVARTPVTQVDDCIMIPRMSVR
jgi:hypothetical protein